MSDLVWSLVFAFGITVKMTFLGTGIWLNVLRLTGRAEKRPEAVRWIFKWAKRCYPVVVPLYWLAKVLIEGPLDGWDALFIICDWWNYRSLKGEDDDDLWKRLREKVTDTVKNLGHRLVVVPQGS